MGPVISAGAKKSISSYIEQGKTEGRLITGGDAAPEEGHFIQPTVIADVDRSARIFQEEIFGPVLAVTKAKDFDHALKLANDTEYGLTGAVYTEQPGKDREGSRQLLRWQSLHKSKVYRRHGGGPSVRRIQHVRYGFKGRRSRLSIAVPATEVDCRKGWIESASTHEHDRLSRTPGSPT